MKRQKTFRSPVAQIILLPTRRHILGVLGTVLLVMSGCASPKLHDVKYIPSVKTELTTRPQPAKVSREPVESLLQKDYAEIGTVEAFIVVERCDAGGNRCKPVTVTEDPTALCLHKATAQGGDYVIFSAENVASKETLQKKVCTEWTTESATELYCPGDTRVCDYKGSCYNKYTPCTTRTVQRPICNFHKYVVTGIEITRQSRGSVWRHDPDLAVAQRREEADRQAQELARDAEWKRNAEEQRRKEAVRQALILARDAQEQRYDEERQPLWQARVLALMQPPPNWKTFGNNDRFTFYYDTKSITYPSQNVVRVKVDYVAKPEGVRHLLAEKGKRYENFKHYLLLVETNCIIQGPNYCELELHHLSDSEIVIHSIESKTCPHIEKGSPLDNLFKELCHATKIK